MEGRGRATLDAGCAAAAGRPHDSCQLAGLMGCWSAAGPAVQVGANMLVCGVAAAVLLPLLLLLLPCNLRRMPAAASPGTYSITMLTLRGDRNTWWKRTMCGCLRAQAGSVRAA